MELLNSLGACCLGTMQLLQTAWQGDAQHGDPVLSALAETDIRLFDPHAHDTQRSFDDFLRVTPMTNQRPLPALLVEDLTASLSFYRRSGGTEAASYFVATYIDKSVIAPRSEQTRRAVQRRYGEDLYPQAICPVFAAPGKADKDEMLATAVGLPAALFADAPGSREGYHTLFLLTEVSHCGFVARAPRHAPVIPGSADLHGLRSVIEAVGDYEATLAFRHLRGSSIGPDEADALFAGRILATFLGRSGSAYAPIPALTLSYDEVGAASRTIDSGGAMAAVKTARALFRRLTVREDRGRLSPSSLDRMAQTIRAHVARHPVHEQSAVHVRMLALFPRAVDVLAGTDAAGFPTHRAAQANLTLPGVQKLAVAAVGSGHRLQ